MSIENKKVPANAFVFQNKENPFSFAREDAEENARLSRVSILGYSGGVIVGHWWWGNLVMDLQGARFSKDKYPILFAHDTSRPVGFSGKPTVDSNGLSVQDGTLLDNDEATEFANNSAAGFPYEASIRVQPSRIEYVKEGVSTEVNGTVFEGPGHVFREFEYKEVSVCVFGWDANTQSTAFGKDNFVDIQIHKEREEQPMNFDITKFSTEQPDAYKALQAHFTNDASSAPAENAAFAQVQAELEAVKRERDELATKFTSAQTAETELSKRVAETEKALMFMREQALRTTFSAMVTTKLAESKLPERLHGKFALMFGVDAYAKEDGSIDTEKFNTAFAAELAEWEAAVGTTAPTVIGGGVSSFAKDAGGTSIVSEEQFAQMAAQMGCAEWK